MGYIYKYNALSDEFDIVLDTTLLTLKGVVDTLADLPLTGNTENDCYIVKTDDRMYTWNKAEPEGELSDWLDIGSVTSVDWSIITNKPSSAVGDIDDAVTKKHDHSNKTELDLITDGDHDVRIDNPHAVNVDQLDWSSGIGKVEIEDAVDKKHDSSLLGTKTLDETDIGDEKAIVYDLGNDKLKYVASALADKIFEGDSKVEVVDTGTGYVTLVTDNVERVRVNASGLEIPEYGSSIGSPVFTGTGLDDMQISGTYIGLTELTIRVQINSEGSPDQYKLMIGGIWGWYTEGCDIPTDFKGITISFSNSTGHTTGDYWTFTCTPLQGGFINSPAYKINDKLMLQTHPYAGIGNIFIGEEAGLSVGGATENIFIGYKAGRNYVGTPPWTRDGVYNGNIFIGSHAGETATGTGEGDSIFIGIYAGYNGVQSCRQNICIGTNAGYNIDWGCGMTLIGFHAGSTTTVGCYGVMIGAYAGEYNIGSNYPGNVFLGGYAGQSSSTARRCIFIGYKAGQSETNDSRLHIGDGEEASPLIYGEFDNALLRINGNLEVTGELTIKVYSQADEPTLDADSKMAMWIDTDDANRVYLLFRRGTGDQVAVELA